MQVIEADIRKIKPYEKNARRNDKAIPGVAESIKQFGWQQPIVVDKDLVIIVGHTRYAAAKSLGLTTVPVVIADNLSEDQVKAYRLVDNKSGEVADWDFKLLEEELAELPDFGMEEWGFDLDFGTEDHKKAAKNTQHLVENIVNLGKAEYRGVGSYDIPLLDATYELPEIREWIGFNYVLSDKEPEGKAVHFFIDDYQFERIWNHPEKYVEKLKQYVCVATPDFSPYGDMPLALQIYNHYRKHWVGRYLQDHGVTVIPTVRASTDPRSFEWYLEGEPSGGIVIISAMWTKDQEAREIFLEEYNRMYAELNPCRVIVYGGKIRDLPGNVSYIESFGEKRWK